MRLEFPNIKHKKNYKELIKEWSEIEDLEEISPGALFLGNNYEEFLRLTEEYVNNSPTGVNSTLFFLTDNEKIIGGLQIRHDLGNNILFEKGGHIGYGIAPKYRKKGYATKMLELGLVEANKLGLNKILITCNIDNIGSKKVIEKNGGIFERLTKDGKMNRYGIKL